MRYLQKTLSCLNKETSENWYSKTPYGSALQGVQSFVEEILFDVLVFEKIEVLFDFNLDFHFQLQPRLANGVNNFEAER